MKIPILSKYLERRSSLTKWLKWLELEGANASNAGVYINQDSALSSAAVLAALRVLSTTMAQLPLPLYRRDANGSKKRADKHPLFTILHDEPNNYQTAFEFRQMMMVHALLHGNFYALIDRDANSGEVTRLLPFANPLNMECKLFEDVVQYKYTLPDGTSKILDDRTVLHIRGMSATGLMGLSLLEKGRDTIGVSLALQQFVARFFKNGANLQGVLQQPAGGKVLSKEAKDYLRKSWEETYSGSRNSFKTAILEEGMEYKAIGVSPDDAQALESRQFQVNEVARIFGVPPHLIGDLTRSTNNNIEHQSIEYVMYCIAPWAVNIQQRISKQLLNSDEKQQYFAEFTLAALMRGDYKSRQEGLNIMRQNGIISTNDWRGLENMNPIADDGADAYLVNGNMISIKAAMEATPGQGFGQQDEPAAAEPEPEPPKEPDPEPAKKKKKKSCECGHEHRSDGELDDDDPAFAKVDAAAALEPVLKEAYTRILRRETEKLNSVLSKTLGRDQGTFALWAAEYYQTELPEYSYKQFYPVAEAAARAVESAAWADLEVAGIDRLDDYDIKPAAEAYARNLTTEYTVSHQEQINWLLENTPGDEVAKRAAIEARMAEWQVSSIEEAVNYEKWHSGNELARKQYKTAGATKMRWVTRPGCCEWCNHLNGKVVSIDSRFIQAGINEGIGMVKKAKRTPPLHIHCRCSIAPEI